MVDEDSAQIDNVLENVLKNAFEQNDADVWNNVQFVRPNGEWAFAEYDLRKMLRRRK